MILPATIEIQIMHASGLPNPLANILLGLKIFTIDGGWHNFSFFKTDVEGHVLLTKAQIIENTELKVGGYIESETPTKFELYIQGGRLTANLIKSTQRLLELYKDKEFLVADLSRRGIAEENIPAAIEAAQKKSGEDKAFFEHIKDAVNDKIQVVTTRITDVWLDSWPKQYTFIVS
jgi:hypothetical protein